LGYTVAPTSGADALLSVNALEGVPVHLTVPQVGVVSLAQGSINIIRVNNELLLVAGDASFRRSASSPAEGGNDGLVVEQIIRLEVQRVARLELEWE
jgi:hypothetical protein